MAVREPLYRECATLIVDSEREWPEQVARRIARQINTQAGYRFPSAAGDGGDR